MKSTWIPPKPKEVPPDKLIIKPHGEAWGANPTPVPKVSAVYKHNLSALPPQRRINRRDWYKKYVARGYKENPDHPLSVDERGHVKQMINGKGEGGGGRPGELGEGTSTPGGGGLYPDYVR